MNFAEWNAALGVTFLDEGPNRPVYFSATDSELQQICDELQVDLADPAADLRAAVRPYSFLSFVVLHREWERSRTKDIPPWLPFLAASTVIVDRQTELGSTAFYAPLSEFLNRSTRITQLEYESTFFEWWGALKRWLEDEDRHAGSRGFATWGSIPQSPSPRSVIGHPYTQVLLRREERRQIDDFFAEFDHLNTEPPAARDRVAVANQLVEALRRWARERHRISDRLRKVLEGENNDDTLSLGYLLLDRLFDEQSGDQREDSSTRVVRLVPAYDDYSRVLRLVAIAPNWVRGTDPVFVPHADDYLRDPGDAVSVDIPVTDQLLRAGIEVGDGPIARFVDHRRYVMAAREWALWCSVEGALPNEELHILLEAREAEQFGLRAISGIRDLPTGWAICGPVTLEQLPPRLAEGAAASHRQLVPRLRGGLRLQSRTYLHGGEPQLELSGFESQLTIDGADIPTTGGAVSLSELGLPVGTHAIETGGFGFSFNTIQSLQPVEVRPRLGRDCAGVVVPFDSSDDLLTGARLSGVLGSRDHPGLIPHVDRFIKLGVPGEIGVVEGPETARWAQAVSLPHLAVEVHAKSTHPDGDRLIKVPHWIAWVTSDGRWALAEFPQAGSDRDGDAPFNPRAWRRICEQIGAEPEVWSATGRSVKEPEPALERWRAYCNSAVAE